MERLSLYKQEGAAYVIDGDAIVAARERLGLSRAALATELGCGVMTLWRWEVGQFEPRKEYVEKLADVICRANKQEVPS